MSTSPDLSRYVDVEALEAAGEVQARLFGIFLDAAMPSLALTAHQHGLALPVVLTAFMAMRQAEAMEQTCAALEELADGLRKHNTDDPDEPWKGTP